MNLRRSLRTAFEPSRLRRVLPADPAGEETRLGATRRFFDHLHRSFVRTLERQELREQRARRRPRRSWVSKIRPRLAGREFLLAHRGETFRFVDPLSGVLRVDRVVDDEYQPLEVITLQREGGEFRAIRRSTDASQVGFRFTTHKQLLASYLG